MPGSAVLGVPQRTAEKGVETSVRGPQDGGQGHLITESPGSFSIESCFSPLDLEEVEARSAYRVRCQFPSGFDLSFQDFD